MLWKKRCFTLQSMGHTNHKFPNIRNMECSNTLEINTYLQGLQHGDRFQEFLVHLSLKRRRGEEVRSYFLVDRSCYLLACCSTDDSLKCFTS